MPIQPILPPPVALSEMEKAYIEESPAGLWPDNQDSNFGAHRKVVCDVLMDVLNQLQLILNEKFPSTSSTYLAFHEEMIGVPIAPAGKTIAQRQLIVIARYKKGPFTWGLRASVVEAAIIATFGPALVFGTQGITIGPGVQLFSGLSGNVKQYYLITENISAFSYQVFIDSRTSPDMAELTRELNRITPAGITYTFGTLYNKSGGGVSVGKGGGVHH